jgi:phosphate transport system substrate-binding protein
MKRAKCTIVILGLALAGCGGPVAAPTVTPYTVEVRILATTATYPLLQDLLAVYTRPGTLLAVNSAVADWETIHGRLLAGDAPFALTTYLPQNIHLWVAQIGQDGIAIVVHSTNRVPSLTVEELRTIFQGRVARWSQVGGPDLPVTVVSREPGADTRLAFEALVMGDRRTTLGARLALSSQSIVEIVGSEPGAVGYVSMAFLNEQVRSVPIAAEGGGPPIPLTRETVSGDTYPLHTPILVVGPNPPAEDSIYRDWFSWMQSEAGQAVVGQRYGTLHP